jgi:ATP-dependent phosphofructokinase / diphosphate-dependent phosphofructokinase
MTGPKGNMVIGQSGGPSAVINSSVYGAINEAMRHAEIDGIYGMLHGIRGFLREDLIDLRQEASDVLDGLLTTPSAALGSCRYRLQESDYERIIDVCRAHDIRHFFYVGGNDTMHNTHEIGLRALAEGYELHVMGIPKTIDNDLPFTDHCPGFGSAARYEAIMCQEIVRDSRALRHTERVKVVEIMGRNSGWVTAATSLADDYAPDLIYVPERPFSKERFLSDVEEVVRRQDYVVIAACEGLRNMDGSLVSANLDPLNVDAFGHPELGGLGQHLVDLCSTELSLKSRLDKPGTMQRSSGMCQSSVDSREAAMVGAAAVRQAIEGQSGWMVTLVRDPGPEYCCTTGLARLDEVANVEKLLPDDFINSEGNGVTEAFRRYARPLIGGSLPAYVTLAAHPISKLLPRTWGADS